MHLADAASSRIEFLRQFSTIMLGFSRCDTLRLDLYGDICCRCMARARPAESFTFELLDNNNASGKLLGKRTVRDLGRQASGQLGSMTEQGTFWTVRATAGRRCSSTDKKGRAGNVTSLAVIPFELSRGDRGILQLESRRLAIFTKETIRFYEAIAQALGLGLADRRAHAALRERVKELTCLYGISRATSQGDLSVDASLDRIVRLLPSAWQFPEIAVARIVLDDKTHATGEFDAACCRQSENIVIDGECRGLVEVGYVERKPEFVEGFFLEEEGDLLRAVAQEVAEFVSKNHAAELHRKLEQQIRHADRLATIGQLAAGVAHEINEPLNAILGCAQLARKDTALTAETTTDLDDIIAASLQAREIVNKLMLFARQRPLRKTLVSMNQIVREGISILEARCAKEGVAMVKNLAEDLPLILADPAQLQQVLVNLVVNSLQAMPDGGTLTITTASDEQAAALMVEDTGLGMSEEVREQIFEPFFTTKDVGEGTGLGLSVVHGIVTSHRGTIECESEPGRGTRFTVRFPRLTPPDTESQEQDVRQQE